MNLGECDLDDLLDISDDPKRDKTRILFPMWCIKGKETVILVDTGMTDEDMNRIGLQNPAKPNILLERINVDPQNVKTIIISHLHDDHFSAHGLYPNATFYAQTKEVAFWATLPTPHSAFEANCHVADLIKLNYAGRVRFINGNEEIMSGIRVVLVGGHTPGNQIITIQTAQGTAVLACDAVHLYKELDDKISAGRRACWPTPNGTVEEESQCLLAYQMVKRLATSPDLIIPGHDPLVMSKFPSVAEGVVKIVGNDLSR
ncbi:N-acyl homoserine lactonase family protein [Chloroflexota bacterium]